MNAYKKPSRLTLGILTSLSLLSVISVAQANTTELTLNDMSKVQSEQEKQIQSEKNLMNQQLQSLTDEMKKIESATLMNSYLIDVSPLSQLGGGDGCVHGGVSAFNAPPPQVPVSNVPYSRGGSKGLGGSSGGSSDGSTNTVSSQIEPLINSDDCKIGENALYDPKCTADQVNNMIDNLFYPYPQQALVGAQSNTPQSVSFNYHMNALRANESLASNARIFVSQEYRNSPDITDSQIQGIANIFGMKDPPAAPISHAGLMDMVVRGTYESTDWYTWLDQTNRAGAMRALAMLKAMRAEQDQRKQKLIGYLVALMDTNAINDQGSRVDKTDAARDVSVSQSLRGVTKQ